MNRAKIFQALLVVCLAQGLDFKELHLGQGGDRPQFYTSPLLGRSSAFNRASSFSSRRPIPIFLTQSDAQISQEPSPLHYAQDQQTKPARPLNEDGAEFRKFFKVNANTDAKTSLVNVANVPLRTVLDQPAEITSNQLVGSTAAIGSIVQGLANLLQKEINTKRCPLLELQYAGFRCSSIAGTCFCVVDGIDPMTFNDADRLCKAVGMDGLLSIDTPDKSFLWSKLFGDLSSTDPIWLSGTDAASLGNFVWKTTGKAFTYTNWATGQPAVSTEPSCVQLVGEKWITAACATEIANVVCELRNVGSYTLPLSGK